MKSNASKTILAIETSCDETAAAVLEFQKHPAWPGFKTLASVVRSQAKLHAPMGGVVPEAAARAHVKYIRPVVEKTLQQAQLKAKDIDYIAVTRGPGLIVSLVVGVEFAKALAFGLDKPLLGINHMAGHLYSPFADLPPTDKADKKKLFPHISLIVSGGHTLLVLMQDPYSWKILGGTVDDAAGEAFDKVAKLLNLPYPGGPEVSKLAALGDPEAIPFPRPMLNQGNFNFSFSGLKTAVLYFWQENKNRWTDIQFKKNICASFQAAVVEVLTEKAFRAAKKFSAASVSLSGGVSANSSLRQALDVGCKKRGFVFLPSPKRLTGDNAEMIALAAAFRLNRSGKTDNIFRMEADPSWPLK